MRVLLLVVAIVLQCVAAVDQFGTCAPPAICPLALTGVPNNQLTGPPCLAPGGCVPMYGQANALQPIVPCLPPACSPLQLKPMRIAKVEKPREPFCDCLLKPECDCRYIDTVEPELKEKYFGGCGCLNSAGDCPCRPHNYHLIKDSCGCLHLQVCPCRMEFVEPETRERHLEPELKDRKEGTPCGCLAQANCPCRVDTVTPEIKEPPCPCMAVLDMPCACRR